MATAKNKTAATAAETRTRKMNEKTDPFVEEGEEVTEGIPAEYAGASEANEMLPLRPALPILNPTQLALRLKFS